jgi:1-aminocyclopropane-1-carboxylate deaminase/D-cysteine desulfhydrase-like pyridoxal-dependent ACC family enzyme
MSQTEYLNISKHEIGEKIQIEVECVGSAQTLASMLYSVMKNDENFANIVCTAVAHYENIFREEKISRLN